MPGNPENKKSEVGRFAFEPTNLAFGFISRDFHKEKLKSTVAICIIATVPLWDQRQELNLVPVKIPVRTAILDAAKSSDLDDKSDTQYFKLPSSNKRIVVFGHTHAALVKASTNAASRKTIYANSGTWIDHNPAGTMMNFVVITPQKSSGSAAEYVNLYTYSNNGSITRLPNPQAIVDLN